MITFIGSPEKAYFVEAVAEQYHKEVNLIPASGNILNQEKRILETPCDYMIFDVDQYADPAYIIAMEILKLRNANNAEVVIFAPGKTKDNVLIQELEKYGIKRFIFTLTLGERKEELRAILSGKEFVNSYAGTEETQKQVTVKTNLKSIAVAGAMHRTGATTQAVQLVKYLLIKGYNACYIEANQSGYVALLAEWYSSEECKKEERVNTKGQKTIFKITVNHIDMFCDLDFLPEILTMNYDYFVYDYGVYNSSSFNKISFYEKNVKIMTCGSEPDELASTKSIIENVFYDNVNYIFSFVPQKDQKEIKLLMDDKAEQTFFAPYTPDRFVYSGEELYEKLLPLEKKETEEKPKSKKRFFGRRKRDV